MSEWALPTQNFIDTNISKEKLYLQPTAVCMRACVCVYIDKATAAVQLPCPTLCDLVDCSTPGLPVSPDLPEFAQVHVH